ncbi:MAG: TrmB family transcriptional regulator, partial [Candidatus Helarchaeota archaeon]
MDLTEKRAIEALTKLGFKEYQAKVYSALVSLGQASATEIHKVSRVPRPRVYDTLKELIDAGAVNFYQSRPIIYKAVEPIHVIENLRKKYLDAGDDAIAQLEKLNIRKQEGEFDLIWVLRGNNNIQQKIEKMISNAEKEIFIRFSFPENFMPFKSQFEVA